MKRVKNFNQRVEYLKKVKKIEINECDEIFLKKIGYINLITPYKHFFYKARDSSGNRIYSKTCTIGDYYEIYKADIQETIKVREIIYSFEKVLKSIIIENISLKYNDLMLDKVNKSIVEQIEKVQKGTKQINYKGQKRINFLGKLKKCFSNEDSYYLVINRLNLSELKGVIDVFKVKSYETNYFLEKFNEIRTLRNSLSHGDTVQMHLNRIGQNKYKSTISCIKKMNSLNLESELIIDYYLLSKSYKKYNLTNL